MEQARFSTVFVALLGGEGVQGFLRAGQLTKATWSPALCWPLAGNTCFHFTGPARQCVQATLHRLRMLLRQQLRPQVPNVLHLAAEHPGALHRPQPRLADSQTSGTVLGPRGHNARCLLCSQNRPHMAAASTSRGKRRVLLSPGGCFCSDPGELLQVSLAHCLPSLA